VTACGRTMLIAFSLTLVLSAVMGNAGVAGNAKRGAYLAAAAGCVSCHTEDRKDAVPFAGGRAVKTPFGTFYGPNITQDREHGIGRWNEADFIRAMRFGVRPDGAPFFPAFPYPSYTKISDGDMRDIWAYLRTIAPSSKPSRPHDLRFPFSWRFGVRIWKWVFFEPGVFVDDPKRPPLVNRGAYLVQALGHCGECHTPRNIFGAMEQNRFLAGGKGPDGKKVPNLTSAHLKKWSDGELKDILTIGIMPDGDVVGETMGEIIRNSTSKLTPQDLSAVIAYLRSLPPIGN
jgi:mono/diheme cytochrome c family protein